MKTEDVITFSENAIYSTEMAAKIMHRSPKTIRALCKRGCIRSQMDRGGYLITGWAIREYAENRFVVRENDLSNKFP